MHKLRIRNARQLVCICSQGELAKSSLEAMQEVCVIENGSIVVGSDGNIVAVGNDDHVRAQIGPEATFDLDIDASGKVVLPGFVDGHQHPVWSGDRVHEFAMKLAGASYMDIHKQGGGIGFTVKHVHQSSEQELKTLLLQRLDKMLQQGSTTIEGKSGYGLDTENELKMLRVLHQANQEHAIDIVSNFCGAHSVPKGKTAAEATLDVVEHQIPAVVDAKQRGEISPTLIDVFCEKNVFELEDTRRILEAGKAAGLQLNFHGEELNPLKSAEMGAELGALAISHLEWVSDEGIASMARSGTAAVLLPTTAYVLKIDVPPARKLLEKGVIVALGTDFNPNAHCYSMPFVMNLACITMGMTMEEVLNASTINSAKSMGVSERCGSLEPGKLGDIVILDAPAWQHLIYQLADPPIDSVFKNGELVYKKHQ